MNKKAIPLNLNAQFTIVSSCALAASLIVFGILLSLGSYIIRNKVNDTEYVEQIISNKVNQFQQYVAENQISTTDAQAISTWVSNQKNVTLAVYDENSVLYDSTIAWKQNHAPIDERPPAGYRTFYDISFADKEASVELFVLIEFRLISTVIILSIIASVFTFMFILSTFIRYKVIYIKKLENEVNILEGGDLSYRVTVKGGDELAYLAKSIDNMRTSIIERQKEEEQAREANHKLVTAMSHDLRTPLTILIGLLEIIDGKKYADEEALKQYITKAKNKAYQIKELSDRIFEYFFAFDMKESQLNRELYGIDVINTMLEDYIFSLSQKGYTFEYTQCNSSHKVYIDVKIFSRVFGNIFSNILKYADKEKPVIITSSNDDSVLTIEVENAVKQRGHREESTNIGLEVCSNIVKQHNGEFYYLDNDETFKAVIKLNIKK